LRKNIWICEEGLLRLLLSLVIFHFSVNTSLGLIVDPFANKELVLVVIEIRSLPFSQIIDPVTFKVISITLG